MQNALCIFQQGRVHVLAYTTAVNTIGKSLAVLTVKWRTLCSLFGKAKHVYWPTQQQRTRPPRAWLFWLLNGECLVHFSARPSACAGPPDSSEHNRPEPGSGECEDEDSGAGDPGGHVPCAWRAPQGPWCHDASAETRCWTNQVSGQWAVQFSLSQLKMVSVNIHVSGVFPVDAFQTGPVIVLLNWIVIWLLSVFISFAVSKY